MNSQRHFQETPIERLHRISILSHSNCHRLGRFLVRPSSGTSTISNVAQIFSLLNGPHRCRFLFITSLRNWQAKKRIRFLSTRYSNDGFYNRLRHKVANAMVPGPTQCRFKSNKIEVARTAGGINSRMKLNIRSITSGDFFSSTELSRANASNCDMSKHVPPIIRDCGNPYVL